MADVIIPPALREAHRQGFARYLATREAHVMNRHLELTARRSDGSEFPVELTIIRLPTPGPPAFTAFLRDITERVRARDRAQRLQQATAALAQAITPEDVATVAMEQVVTALGAAAGAVYQAGDDGTLELVTATGYPDTYRDAWGRLAPDAALPHAEAMRTGLPVFIGSETMWHEQFSEAGPLRSLPDSIAWAAIPLVVDGRPQGTIGLSFAQVGGASAFDDDAQTVALALAQQCGQALERARLYAAMRNANAELAIKNEQLQEQALESEAQAEELELTAEHLQQQTAEAERARLAAEEADRAKSEFLAAMSHELRTPLNAIGGYVELLEMGLRGPVTEDQVADLARIKRSQQHLLGLINDVLNFAKLGAGRIEYRLTEVGVDAAVRDAEAMVAPQMRSKGLVYRHTPSGDATSVRADREKLRQILLNLLTNAIKFTPTGGEIRVSSWADGTAVHACIADTGIGVPADKLDVIFDPFVQVPRQLTASSHGVGLGLAISRDLARAMGGDLTVQSTVGVGSVFTLRLPGAGHPEDA